MSPPKLPLFSPSSFPGAPRRAFPGVTAPRNPFYPFARHRVRDGGLFPATRAKALAPHLPNECDRVSDGEHCSKVHSCEAVNEPSCADEQT